MDRTPLSCSRCHGMMVTVRLEDVNGTTRREPLLGWRCLQCGEVLDAGIVDNRRAHQHPVKNRARLPCGVMVQQSGKPKLKKAGRK